MGNAGGSSLVDINGKIYIDVQKRSPVFTLNVVFLCFRKRRVVEMRINKPPNKRRYVMKHIYELCIYQHLIRIENVLKQRYKHHKSIYILSYVVSPWQPGRENRPLEQYQERGCTEMLRHFSCTVSFLFALLKGKRLCS